jgi:hypothetical protein
MSDPTQPTIDGKAFIMRVAELVRDVDAVANDARMLHDGITDMQELDIFVRLDEGSRRYATLLRHDALPALMALDALERKDGPS